MGGDAPAGVAYAVLAGCLPEPELAGKGKGGSRKGGRDVPVAPQMTMSYRRPCFLRGIVMVKGGGECRCD